MAVLEMKKVETSTGEFGGIYYTDISITSGTSDIYLLPTSSIYTIGLSVENGDIYFTIDSEEKIRNSTAYYIAWDHTSEISLAVTGFYVQHIVDTASAQITVKTRRI